MNDNESPDTREQYSRAQIDAWEVSDQSQQAFCKANGLNYPRFGYWLRKFRRQGEVTQSPRGIGFRASCGRIDKWRFEHTPAQRYRVAPG